MVTLALSALTFLAVSFVVGSVLTLSSSRRALLEQRIGEYLPRASVLAPSIIDVLRTQRIGLTPTLDRIVKSTSIAERLSIELQRANLPLQPGEFIALNVGAAVVFFALGGFAAGSAFIGVVAAVMSVVAIRFFVKHRQQALLRALESQLPDAIDLITSSLKSGFGLLQGMEMVAREMPRPISDEFSQVVRDISLGMQLDDALLGLCRRLPGHDIYLLVTAILVHRTVGGNLSEVLGGIAQTIRARMRLRLEIHALTTTTRVSGYVVTALPFVVFVAIWLSNASYVSMLWTTGIGRLMSVTAGVMMVIGMFLAKRFTEIDY